MRPARLETPACRHRRSVFQQVSVAEDRRFELLRGCPQRAFQVCASAFTPVRAVRDLGGLQLAGSADAREPRRMRLRMRLGRSGGLILASQPGPRHRATPDVWRSCAPETVAPRRAGADRHQAGPVGGITLSDRGIRGERAPTRLMYVWRLLGAGRQRCAYVADLRTSRSVLPPLGCERLLRRVCDATAIPRWVLRLSAARPGC